MNWCYIIFIAIITVFAFIVCSFPKENSPMEIKLSKDYSYESIYLIFAKAIAFVNNEKFQSLKPHKPIGLWSIKNDWVIDYQNQHLCTIPDMINNKKTNRKSLKIIVDESTTNNTIRYNILIELLNRIQKEMNK